MSTDKLLARAEREAEQQTKEVSDPPRRWYFHTVEEREAWVRERRKIRRVLQRRGRMRP